MKPFLGFFLLFITLLPADKIDDNLPINQLQVIGSHNSYKKAINPNLFKYLSKVDSAGMLTLDYSHIGLSEQLNLGLLNLEIDIYADSKGGKYAQPKGLDWIKDQPSYNEDSVMNEPGFKVFHVQDMDFRSHCPTFKLCLQELKQWSDAHPNHYPIFITMNAKDEVMKRPGFTVPEKFTTAIFNELDKTILENLSSKKLVSPDNVRGRYKTLEQAVFAGNWPKLKDAKGKFIFILDENEEKRALYSKGHASLKKRVLFMNAEPGSPEAAIVIRNNPLKDTISLLVKQGYIVRTRADADTKEARKNDRTKFEAACNSGAQIITTDYYKKSTHFPSEYVVGFEGGTYVRLNPLFKQ